MEHSREQGPTIGSDRPGRLDLLIWTSAVVSIGSGNGSFVIWQATGAASKSAKGIRRAADISASSIFVSMGERRPPLAAGPATT